MYGGSIVKADPSHDQQNSFVSVSPATQNMTHQGQVSGKIPPAFEHDPLYTPEVETSTCGSNQRDEGGRFVEVTPTAHSFPEKSPEEVCIPGMDHGIEHGNSTSSPYGNCSRQDNSRTLGRFTANTTSASVFSGKPSGLDLLLLAVTASPDANSDQDESECAGSQDTVSTNHDTDDQLKEASIATSRPRRTRIKPTQKEPMLPPAKLTNNAVAPKRSKSKKKTPKSNDQKSASGAIETPSDLDILRGRGGTTNRHKGNMRFRDEARKLRSAYRDDGVSRKEKYMYSNILLQAVKDYGGRFLEKGDDGFWYEMSENAARKKASQGSFYYRKDVSSQWTLTLTASLFRCIVVQCCEKGIGTKLLVQFCT